MTRYLALASAAVLLSGCSTLSGPDDLFGYATPRPGVLASAPDLLAAAGPGAVRPLQAEPQRTGSLKAAPSGANPAAAAVTREERERDEMIASALAPASAHQRLGELELDTSGSMVLPAARDLEIIDISPIRSSMTIADGSAPGL